uniref:Agglutinin n=1 Tax=Anthurium amnicola TaxID=1678845 RepID=A0A1D1YES6_9ARAE
MSLIQNGEILVKMGARGEVAGRCDDWDEVCFGSVRQILVTHGDAVNSIQITYDLNGTLVLSHRRGGDGDKLDCVNLEPWESFTAISGHYGSVDDSGATVVIRSLSFTTNRATYGPFGQEEGTAFTFKFQSGVSFGGFHGRSSADYLRAIGIYVMTRARHHFKPEPGRYSSLPAFCAAAEDSRRQALGLWDVDGCCRCDGNGNKRLT